MSKKIVRLNETITDSSDNDSKLTVASIIVRSMDSMSIVDIPQGHTGALPKATQKDWNRARRRSRVARQIMAASKVEPYRLEKMSDDDWEVVEEALQVNMVGFNNAMMSPVIEAVLGISYTDAGEVEESEPHLEAVV